MEEKEVKVIYKKKNSTGKTITIIILVLIVLGLLSYIGYTRYQEIMLEKEEEKTEEREELYYSEVENLLSQIEDYNEVLSKNYPITDYKELDNQEKLKFGIYLLTKYENTKNYYKTADMKQILKNYFTEDFTVVYESITCDQKDGVLYNLDNGTYTMDNSHEHGVESMRINTYYVDSNKLDNIYKVTVNILYSNYCTGTCPDTSEYYETWNDAKQGQNKVLDSIKEYSEKKESLKKTTFTFEKENDSYLLKNVKIINP